MRTTRGGYQALRASTYSVFPKDRKELEKSGDHAQAMGATAGPSIFTLAYELLDMQIEETVPRRTAEPITRRRWKDQMTEVRKDITAAKGKEAGEQALASAMAIVELLSAEGLLGLRANPFFDGAIPDRIAGPHGPALAICLGMRLAIHWNEYGLARPSNCDLYANEQLKIVWGTSGARPLPIPEPNVWALDLVLKAGLKEAEGECDEMRRDNGIPATAELNIIGDNKVFLARLGQAVITRNFGLGAAISPQADSMQQREEAEGEEEDGEEEDEEDEEDEEAGDEGEGAMLGRAAFGGDGSARNGASDGAFVKGVRRALPSPWRFQDGAQRARDQCLAKQGIAFEGVDTPLVNLAPPGPRRTALVRMALDCETWLRTGMFRHGVLSPANADAHPNQPKRVEAFAKTLRKLMLPHLTTKTFATGKSVEAIAAHVLDREINTAAFEHAVNSAQVLLVHGPMLHLSQQMGTYVVAPSQHSPCSECEQPVHVLSGIMFKHTYSECTACHAKRCLECTAHYGKVIKTATEALSKSGKSGPYAIGRKCTKCFAEPAQLCVKYACTPGGTNNNNRVLDVNLTARVAKKLPATLRGSSASPLSASVLPTGGAPGSDAPPTFVPGAATTGPQAKCGARKRRTGNK